MKKHSSSALVAIAAMSMAAFGAPAIAQDYDDEVVVVTAPYSVNYERARGGDQVSVTRSVPLKGLDLRYDAHVEELERRVAWTAHSVCETAEEYLEGRSDITDRECVRRAIREANDDVRYVVNRARG